MILQKDLTLYRLDNQKPDQFAPEKYEYQLFKKGKRILSQYSDNVYSLGKVSVKATRNMEVMALELLTPADVDSRVIEDDSFLIQIR